ncbi:PRC-barrel domain-containing protein [Frigidibacter sp. MR17.24]|uniref:PRC-barrel domain-containing protein n=1 Tax=Frigidibacter sp. MR17.24 TaxID=3127345 RepID=UPI0030129F7B
MTKHLSSLFQACAIAALAAGTAQAQSSEGGSTVTQGGTMAESPPETGSGATEQQSDMPEGTTAGSGSTAPDSAGSDTGTQDAAEGSPPAAKPGRSMTGGDTAMPTPGGPFGYQRAEGDLSAEELTDRNLYVSDTDVGRDAMFDEPDAAWEDVGEIEDLVISPEGQVRAVVVDMGGFLGIGEKRVAVSMENLRMVRGNDADGDYYVVFTSTREDLENAPEFNWED